MDIQICCRREIPGLKNRTIEANLAKVLGALGCHDRELSVLLTTDADIARLNQGYLGREGATNVLAFPMSGGPAPEVASAMLGDVVISVDTAVKESAVCGEALHQTINRLLIHGVLHLLGYDHERSAAEAKRMEAAEGRLMAVVREGN